MKKFKQFINESKNTTIVLVDFLGSMHGFEHLVNEKLKEYNKENIYWLRNKPDKHFYKNPNWTNVIEYDSMLELINNSTNLVIISDGGKSFNTENLQAWWRFKKKITLSHENIIWFNPLPKERWNGKTSGYLSKLFNMEPLIPNEENISESESYETLIKLASFNWNLDTTLLYKIQKEYGSKYNIPRIAISDLIKSRFVQERSTRLYELIPDYDSTDRNLSGQENKFNSRKKNLKDFDGINLPTLKEYANFILKYLEERYSEKDNFEEPYREVEYWTALFFTNKKEFYKEMDRVFDKNNPKYYKIQELRAKEVKDFVESL